jgi:hypothetical protein
MAGGFRITEDGNVRVTESSDSRVTENFESGTASISAAGSITASASITFSAEFTTDSTEYTRITEAGDRRITEQGDVRLTGNTNPNTAVGSVMLVGVSTVFGRTNLSGVGSLAVEGNLVFSVDSAMSGAGSQTAVPLLTHAGLSNLSASGTIAADALFVLFAESALTGAGSLTSSARMDYSPTFESINVDFTRITESGDRRVLENGDVRITDDVVSNSAEGVLIVFSDRIAFSAEPYVKVLTDWKAFTPYVKYEDNWTVPDKMYKHVNGNWKRIY